MAAVAGKLLGFLDGLRQTVTPMFCSSVILGNIASNILAGLLPDTNLYGIICVVSCMAMFQFRKIILLFAFLLNQSMLGLKAYSLTEDSTPLHTVCTAQISLDSKKQHKKCVFGFQAMVNKRINLQNISRKNFLVTLNLALTILSCLYTQHNNYSEKRLVQNIRGM